ncbi:MAG: SRPBCC family protein [Planctomycetota bacterium]
MNTSSDQIQKVVSLRASRARVWRAIADSSELGKWFQVEFEGPFRLGESIKGRSTHEDCKAAEIEASIEELEPELLFSFRWHPYEIDSGIDRSQAPSTLVEFRLEDEGEGTRLTITESGFDALPKDRRDESFQRNEGGWKQQVKNVTKHVDG